MLAPHPVVELEARVDAGRLDVGVAVEDVAPEDGPLAPRGPVR